MRKLTFAALTGVVGALLLHVLIVFGVPYFAVNDAWSKMRDLPIDGRFVAPRSFLPRGSEDLATLDRPFSRTVVCRFDIAQSPIRLTASGHVPFWSLAVFDSHSNELFSMNDRTAEGNRLDVTLATPLAMIALREEVPPPLAETVLVETPQPQGYVLLRTVIPDETWTGAAEAFLASASCAPIAG